MNKDQVAANLSLLLVATGSPIFIYYFLGVLGDAYPRQSPEEMATTARHAQLAFAYGVGALGGSLWMSGYAFRVAPIRSIVAALLCVSFVVGVCYLA